MSRQAKNKTSKKVSLIFNMAIAEMLSWVELIISYFAEDQADFAAYSPKYTAEFLAAWQAKSTACRFIPTNSQDRAVLQQKTESLKSLMKKRQFCL